MSIEDWFIKGRIMVETEPPNYEINDRDLAIVINDNGFVKFGDAEKNEEIFFLTNEEIEMLYKASQTALREQERELRLEQIQGV